MANFNFNKVFLGGKIVVDPENKQTQNGDSVTTFRVAVNRRGKEGNNTAEFFNITAWRQTAEFVAKYFHKGSSIFITGELHNRSWTGNDGVKRYATDIIAEKVDFVDSKSDGASASGGDAAMPSYYSETGVPGASLPEFSEIKGDEDLPF